tara:strand:- start:60 stop:350 length:291 start_codon:yes stop_codon:yes gene_type:complete
MNEEIAKLLGSIQGKKTPNINELNDHVKAMQKMALEKAVDVFCEECNSNQFTPFFYLKKISEFDSPSGKPSIFPLQAYKCLKCDHVNEIFVKKAED